MKTTQYKTYICCGAIELLPNNKRAARWNTISSSQVDLLSKLNKLRLTKTHATLRNITKF